MIRIHIHRSAQSRRFNHTLILLALSIITFCGGLEAGTCEPRDIELVPKDVSTITKGTKFPEKMCPENSCHITLLIQSTILPEMNRIWKKSNIRWRIENIIEESIVKPNNYEQLKSIVENAERDDEGHADSTRLAPLYEFQDPRHRSKANELEGNLFHIYIYPFIGNTSQGNAMRSYGYHTVVGSWSNKFTGGQTPEKSPLVEDRNNFRVGSLSRTMAHELGHVLQLSHSDCKHCLMKGKGYRITKNQVDTARRAAKSRDGTACAN